MIIFISILTIITYIILLIIDKEISLKILDIVFSRAVAIELIKAFITAIFGYITFKIYQTYKNKKDNNLLYIQVIKLQTELLNNSSILEKVIKEYDEFYLLKEKFQNDKVLEIYKKIHMLNLFVDEDPVRDVYGEIVDVEYNYYEIPYQLINDIQYNIDILQENEEEYINHVKIEDLKLQSDELRKKSIYNELTEIENLIRKFINLSDKFKVPLDFCLNEIGKFNLLSSDEKRSSLNKFCKNLLEGVNVFSATLKSYDRLIRLGIRFKKKNIKSSNDTIELKFERWNKLEVSLLASYDANNFIILEEFYNNNKEIGIGIWEESVIRLLYKDLNDNISKILIKMKSNLENALSLTNSLFKNI